MWAIAGNPRLPETREERRSPSLLCSDDGSGRSDVAGRRQLAVEPRDPSGGAASFCVFPRQEAARDLGSSCFEAAGREVAGRPHVESPQQRFLPRVQEEAQPGQRRQRRSPKARRSRSSAAKERSKRGKRPDEVREQKEGGGGGALGAAELGKSYEGGANKYEAGHEDALPGSRATTVHGYSLWNSLFDFLGRGRSRLSLTWLAVRAGHALKKASTGRVWPLPLPYPELHRRGGRRGRQESARKLGCNFVVLVLNFLKFPERHWRTVTPPLGTALNKRQWEVVGRISTAIETWNDQDAVTPALMGRAAAKVENVEEVLVDLAAAAFSNFHEGNKYGNGGKLGMQSSWGNQGSPGDVVGVLSKDPACLARAVKPERLKFWQTPSFDPLPFLDDDNGATFSRPLDFARPPVLEDVGPPRVRVRMAQKDRVKFLELLDIAVVALLCSLANLRDRVLRMGSLWCRRTRPETAWCWTLALPTA